MQLDAFLSRPLLPEEEEGATSSMTPPGRNTFSSSSSSSSRSAAATALLPAAAPRPPARFFLPPAADSAIRVSRPSTETGAEATASATVMRYIWEAAETPLLLLLLTPPLQLRRGIKEGTPMGMAPSSMGALVAGL